jgi:hypothetical protein
MNKKTKSIISITIIIGCCALLFWGYSALRSFLAHDEFGGPAEIFATKADSPFTLEQARKNIRLPLPDEASDIYYAYYAQWIAYDFIVKFKAPVETCKSHAMLLIKQYNENEGNADRHIPLEFKDITEPPQMVQIGPPLNVDWFDVSHIKNGLMIAGNNSMQPSIWIDTDRNLFYYRLTD